MKSKIVVFFGGKSVEHDISIITGVQAIQNLNTLKYEILPIYIDKLERFWTGEELKKLEFFKSGVDYKKLKRVAMLAGDKNLYVIKGRKLKTLGEIDCAINCTHGLNGEDGCISAIMQISQIPFASPEIMGSSIALDKMVSKLALKGAGINVAKGQEVSLQEFNKDKTKAIEFTKKLSYPVIIKPSRLGSSIGVKVCANEEELIESLTEAFIFDQNILVEKAFTDFVEYNCSGIKLNSEVLVSEIEKPVSSGEILSFNDKYVSSGGREFPAKISASLEKKIKKTTAEIYRLFKLSGVIRIDFIYDNTSKTLYVNEVNTVPGSLAFYLWKDKFNFSSMLDSLITEAKHNQAEKDKLCFTLNTAVLSKVNLNGTKNSKLK